MKLTSKSCNNFEIKDKPYKKSDGGGLFLEIKPNGSKLWKMKYRFPKGGKEKLLSFGNYPLVSLADAREKREDAKKLLLDNIDPSAHKKKLAEQKEADNALTFERVAREWWSTKKKGVIADNSAGYIIRRLEQKIFPEIGHLAIKEITPPVLLDALRKTQKERTKHDLYDFNTKK